MHEAGQNKSAPHSVSVHIIPSLKNLRASLLVGTALTLFLSGQAVAAATVSPAGQSLPQTGQVVSGSAKIIVKPNEVIVKQTSETAIIDWQSFNIGAGDKVIFIEPNQLAQILNRVVGSGASQILGQLQANGTVIITNPNGILFGVGADVNVRAIIATTAGITNQNFMSGNMNFNIASNSPTASVVNRGTITAHDAGLVGLVAPGVENSGIIQARLGSVQLVSGNVFTVDLYGDKLIKLAVNDQVLKQVASPDGQPLTSSVANHGLIEADGGTVIMSAQTARDVVSSVINMDGVVRARSVAKNNGEIILDGGTDGTVQVAGTLDASGTQANQTGGTIQMTGDNVMVVDGARLLASGGAGGGTINVGNAQSTATDVETGSTLNASATALGNGGTVAVLGKNTKAAGTLTAEGGALGGDGGQIETSGNMLDIDGAIVSTFAPNGKSGSWLLDPYDLTIDALAAASIDNALGTSSVKLQTTASSATTAFGGTVNASGSGDITIDAPIVWSANTTLTLDAYHSVQVNADITANGNTAGLNVTTNGGGTGGNFLTGAGASVTLAGANPSLTINSQPYTLIRTASQLQNMGTTGDFALANDIDLSSIPNFTPIGFVAANNDSHPIAFTGTFDGLGHTVSNLTINSSGNFLGLFTDIYTPGTVRNLGLINGNITAAGPNIADVFGLLAGSNQSTVTNVYATGSITANTDDGAIGGLVGTNSGTITNSYASTAIAGGNLSGVGGLVGVNTSSIENSYASGSINAGGSVDVGGLVGDNQGSISNSYATTSVTSLTDVVVSTNIGGLAGDNFGNISNSYATGNVSGYASVGGLVGDNQGPINNSYATGNLSGDNTIGGLAGNNAGSINASFASGGVSGSISLGGLVGLNSQAFGNEGGVINESYSTGPVSSVNGPRGYGEIIGGLAGQNNGLIQNSYSSGDVTSTDNSSQIGGLVGSSFEQGSAISNSYASGSVTTGKNSVSVGGLVGASESAISNSYAIGSVTSGANSQYIGGLVGYNGNVSGTEGTINDSYATGAVSGGAGSQYIGGLAGFDTGTIISGYWDVATTGQTSGCGAGSSACGATALGSSNPSPYAQSSYAGFDFTNMWFMVDGYTRPFLRSEYSTTITNAHQLQLVDLNLAANYMLANNIDMSELTNPSGLWNTTTGFMPIGYGGGFTYTGNFDGLGHTITGLNIDIPAVRSLGLFTDIGSGATVQNLGMIGGDVTGEYTLGMIAGENYGMINNVYSTGSVNGSGSAFWIGGLVGDNEGTISNSYVTGPVGGGSYIGGLAGTSEGTISNSYASGSVTGGPYIGGLAGISTGNVSNSFAAGQINGSFYTGGLVGINDGTISNSYSASSVNGSFYMGGLAGINDETISNSYSTGSVNGSFNMGGLVGINDGSIINSYTTSSTNGSFNTGGLVGINSGTITSSYWDTTTTGQTSGCSGNTTCGGGATGLTTVQWLTQGPAATNAAGWDFTNVWEAGYPYPVLKALPFIDITANDATKTYGTANPAFSIASITDQNGDNASGLVNTSGLTWLTVPTSSDIGNYNMGGSGVAATGYQVTYNGTLDITPKALEISGVSFPTTKVYDDTTSVALTGTAGLLSADAFGTGSADDGVAYSGDAVSLVGQVSAAYNSKNVATASSILLSGGSLTGAKAKDYTLVTTTVAASITPKTLTVTGLSAPDSKVYDGTTAAEVSGKPKLLSDDAPGGGTSTDGKAYTGDVVAFLGTATGNYNDKNVVDADLITFGGLTSSNSNYVLNLGTQKATITPKRLTIIANNEDVIEGNLLPPLSASYYGFVNGENASDLTDQAILKTHATSNSRPGEYVIKVFGAYDPNYSIRYVNGTVTVQSPPLHHHHHHREERWDENKDRDHDRNRDRDKSNHSHEWVADNR